jgi:selenium metabolism protein YedF
MKSVDTRGQLCPKPLIMAKQMFNELAAGEQLDVITDSETSLNNLVNFFTALKALPVTEKHDTIWHVYISKPLKDDVVDLKPEDFCETTLPNGLGRYIITIKSDQMGQGDAELGRLLIRAFINTLAEQAQLPSHIVFYNSGVKLAVKETDTAQSLIDLENKGVTVVLCGTCVDFYGLKGQLAVGMISNMYHITNLMREANKVIAP